MTIYTYHVMSVSSNLTIGFLESDSSQGYEHIFICGFPEKGIPQARWMVFVRDNPHLKWMMTRATPMTSWKPPYVPKTVPGGAKVFRLRISHPPEGLLSGPEAECRTPRRGSGPFRCLRGSFWKGTWMKFCSVDG